MLFFFSSRLAAKKKKTPKGEKYGGSPCELPDNDLPTYADVARCFYAVSEKVKYFNNQLNKVRERVVEVWKKCNPHLPRIQEGAVHMELKRFLIFVRNLNRKQTNHSGSVSTKRRNSSTFQLAAVMCLL